MPKFFCVDKGTKLPFIVEAHFLFFCKVDEKIQEIRDYFWFGKNIKNQQIESWWQKLEMLQLYRWRVCSPLPYQFI